MRFDSLQCKNEIFSSLLHTYLHMCGYIKRLFVIFSFGIFLVCGTSLPVIRQYMQQLDKCRLRQCKALTFDTHFVLCSCIIYFTVNFAMLLLTRLRFYGNLVIECMLESDEKDI